MELGDFEQLTPDLMISAVEDALGVSMSGLAAPLPSYINRVYEFQDNTGERFIAKFYRPGRWIRPAIKDEHDFVLECAAADIPVVAPLRLAGGDTLAMVNGIHFAVYPKRSGREMEILDDDEEFWRRLGSLIARVHNVGARRDAPHRVMHHPGESTGEELTWLMENDSIPISVKREFAVVTGDIMDEIIPMFDDAEYIRIHGDCHRANILQRPEEGLMLIDFDDMMVGPPVQDLWLLLPEHAHASQREIKLIVQGYSMLRDFDRSSLKLIEALRAMRMIYFLAWISKQSKDYLFDTHFPGWGSDSFWRREIGDLRHQLQLIRES